MLGHWPRELSNGQKQRTALARALVADPDILLLDDPLRNVDAKLRYEMRLELPALLKRAGSTVLYVTQDFKEAMALGDRIAVLLDGQIAQCDTPARIYAEPASIGVARLFGDPTLNLVEVEPRLVDGAPEVLVGGAPFRLPATYAAAAGGSYMLGLRPESLHLTDANAPGTIAVDLVAVTPLNEKSVLLLTTEGGNELLASESRRSRRPASCRTRAHRVGPRRRASVRSRKWQAVRPLDDIGVEDMSAALSIRAIDKIYYRRGKPPVHAVKALSMDVGRGEIVGLLGSSGCGKTSTLRMVAGFRRRQRGRDHLADRRVQCLPPAAQMSPWRSRAIRSIGHLPCGRTSPLP